MAAAVERTPGGRVLILDNRTAAGASMAVQQLYRQASFVACPAGDTPESERVYHALQQGAVPLLPTAFQPPAIADWSLIATIGNP